MRAFALVLLVAGCAEEAGNNAQNSAEAPPGAASPEPSAEDLALSRSAADALRLYYDHIARRDWPAAFAMRESQPGLTLERFVAGYERYRDYRATVGVPSLPARQDGVVWVDAPVQLYGRMADGSPFGSVGRVLLKRPPGSDRWTIVG